MASELIPAEMVAHAARMQSSRRDDPFLKPYQRVHEFEHRPRRLGRLHSAVEHRLVWVVEDFGVVVADVGQHIHVDSRT